MNAPRRFARRSCLAACLALVAVPAVGLAQDAPAPPPVAPAPAPAPAPTPAPAPAPTPAPTPDTPPPSNPAPGPGGGLRVGREQMWPAPTAADWAKPCLLTFQRTWEDAVAVAKETGKPILICVNMDGEIASEHYAGVRYRQPEIAALYEPYVCVVASVYRHTPRDYDDEGRRILCPRFGSCTCAEHIAMEAIVYDKFLDGVRVAPRHIAVDLDAQGAASKETFDVYYANDTASVFAKIRDTVAGRPAPTPIVRSDRPVVERVASREVSDRAAAEAAYATADAAARRALLDAATKHPEAAPLDLLRLAIFGVDPDLARQARAALVGVRSPEATELVIEALRAPMDAAEREVLLGTLDQLATTSPRARWIAPVMRGLAGRSGAIDAKAWSEARIDGSVPGFGPTASPEWAALEARRDARAAATKAAPADAENRLVLAETYLSMGEAAPIAYVADPRKARMLARQAYADARREALAAETLGAKGWRVHTLVALAAYQTGDADEAYARAALAVRDLPVGEPGWSSMAVLTIFAESRWKGITKAVKAKQPWPPEWLADVHAAYAALLKHPRGTDGQVQWHHDFLVWLGADEQAARVVRAGLARFQTSALLHARLRHLWLRTKGPDGLERGYEELLAAKDAPAALVGFAAIASTAAAEQRRRDGKLDAAIEAYGRALARYDQADAADPSTKAANDPAVALVLAGRARVAYQQGDDARALADVLAALARAPDAAGTRDGMGITPGETAQMLLARLHDAKQDEASARLDAALRTVDPELLRPDREDAPPR